LAEAQINQDENEKPGAEGQNDENMENLQENQK